MIICWRTVTVPPEWRGRYLDWIAAGRAVRQAHGILAELVLIPAGNPPATLDNTTAPGTAEEFVVLTAWPSHEVFDAWIASPERDALTASEVHQAVDHHPITRYEVTGGYLNPTGLATADLAQRQEGTSP